MKFRGSRYTTLRLKWASWNVERAVCAGITALGMPVAAWRNLEMLASAWAPRDAEDGLYLVARQRLVHVVSATFHNMSCLSMGIVHA